MERSLILLIILTLILGMAGLAHSQTYYGNSYPTQAQTYVPYGQQHGYHGYGNNHAAPQQYSQPQYQAQSPYYGNYNEYISGGSNPYASYYQQQQPVQPSQPNPYYGMPQQPSRQNYHASAQQPAARMTRENTGPTVASRSSNTMESFEDMFKPGAPKTTTEIYWDPNSMPETPEGAIVTPYQPNQSRPRSSVAPRSTPKPKRTNKPRVRRSAKRSVPKPPENKRQSIKWGQNSAADKPEPPKRKAITWGNSQETAGPEPKALSPSKKGIQWGKAPGQGQTELDVDREPQVTTREAQVAESPETKAPSGKFKWGKKN